MTDITVSHPLRLTYLNRAADGILSSCEHAARVKALKYSSLAKKYQCQFAAFACDTFGGLCSSAHQLITQLVYSSPEQGAIRTKGQLRNEMFGAVAVAIVNGNSAVHKHMRIETVKRAANGVEGVHRVGVALRRQNAAAAQRLADLTSERQTGVEDGLTFAEPIHIQKEHAAQQEQTHETHTDNTEIRESVSIIHDEEEAADS